MSMSRILDTSRSSVEESYDIIVVGGGHAGTEAAVAAARSGCTVALVTASLETIGQMSCNPAIGGVAKGTVVREVDALGGIMGRATDLATLQFRMLNRGKGPAVWAPRAQCDRGLYRRAVRSLLEQHQNLFPVQGTVVRLLMDGGRVSGVETQEGRRFGAGAVIITTGTFLRGRMHIGTTTRISGGRAGEGGGAGGSMVSLAEQLEEVGLEAARFKTGTPPRIDGRSVNFGQLMRQESELEEFDYSWSHFWSSPRRGGGEVGVGRGASGADRNPVQGACWITWLGAEGKDLIAEHIGESAMYGGAIGARGPRYCPSVEDKVVRFPEAERHQVFLEPEGQETAELYVNGLSTSLPSAVQLRVIRSVPGLERARMTRPGYAVEYDYYPPTQLDSTLQVRALPGLWLAGQVNGTTGYEEAAGQGVMAGLNAASVVRGGEPVVLGRESSYIGVLIDDLVRRGVDEPYRLFTSRSEFRLTVRQDNALSRLSSTARRLGLYDEREDALVERRLAGEVEARSLAERVSVAPAAVASLLERAGSAPLPHAIRISEVVKRQGVTLQELFEAAGVGGEIPREAVVTAELELKYGGYFAREREAADRLRRMGGVELPHDLPYADFRSLTMEARQKLSARRPMTLAQASSIPGVSPSDLQNLLVELERRRVRAG